MPNQGVRYGRVCSRCRTEDEAILRLAVGEVSTSVCGRRGGQAGAWWGRVHRAGLGVRSENHSSRPPGSGGGRGCGGGAHPQKGGGRPQLAVAQPALEANLVWSKYSNSPSSRRLRFCHRPPLGLSSVSLSPILSVKRDSKAWGGDDGLETPARVY